MVYENEDAMKRSGLKTYEADETDCGNKAMSGRCLAIWQDIRLEPRGCSPVVLGLSEHSAESALTAAVDNSYEKALADRWNKWFTSLPAVKFINENEEKCYYKAWAVVRNNYYDSPVWGLS